jgi:hypothetical protein
VAGECARAATTGSGGASGSGGQGGATPGSGGQGGVSSSGGGSGGDDLSRKEIIGMATGGGGCRCDLPARGTTNARALALGGLVLLAFATRRRARNEGGAL